MESVAVEADAAAATPLACPVAALPEEDELEAAEAPGVDVPLVVLPCTAAAKWACMDDDGWNTGNLCDIIMSSYPYVGAIGC